MLMKTADGFALRENTLNGRRVDAYHIAPVDAPNRGLSFRIDQVPKLIELLQYAAAGPLGRLAIDMEEGNASSTADRMAADPL